MIKKILAAMGAAALILGGVSQIGVNCGVKDACSYICCEHDGELWRN